MGHHWKTIGSNGFPDKSHGITIVTTGFPDQNHCKTNGTNDFPSPRLDESKSGQRVSKKVELAYLDVYISQTM